ncbi:hypothetical protein AAG906_000069 [Vitis piasezkii]
MGVTIGSGCAAQVVATGGLGLPGSCGPSLARIEFDNWDFLSRLCYRLSSRRRETPLMKPGCVAPRFLLLIFLSPGGELAVVVRLPTVFFRWLGAIQNYLPLPYRMNGFGKVWPSLPVIESIFPRRRQCVRTGCPDTPSDGFVTMVREINHWPFTRLAYFNDLNKHIRIIYVGHSDVMFVSVVCLSLRESG